MFSVEQILHNHFPHLEHKPKRQALLKRFLAWILHENDFQQFANRHPHLKGLAFIEQVFSEFDFSYRVSNTQRERIPTEGRVVIVANHPIGSLDGLALLHLVGKVRSDVKIVANQVLSAIKPLDDLLLPVDNMGRKTHKDQINAINMHLEHGGAVIVFPAGEVSRLKNFRVFDRIWARGFLRMAEATSSPILPIFVRAKNSRFFYFCSMLSKPLSTLLLVREMFCHKGNTINFIIGEQIPARNIIGQGISLHVLAKLVKKHTYRIGARKKGIFQTESAIAHPEQRQQLKTAIRKCEQLGITSDNKQIYLSRSNTPAIIMSELGRLREQAFRAVGEGTGKRSDTDRYDAHYMHLILWDPDELEIAGAYRFADTRTTINTQGLDGLYSHSLFEYQQTECEFLNLGLEMGRSFVQPKYWGKRSLDYLWQGIGAFLAANPHYRYLFGPVSISNSLPENARNLLVHFYQTYFPCQMELARSRLPFQFNEQLRQLNISFDGNDYKADFNLLKSALASMGCAIPTLYKQYTELCETGGVQFIDFNVDPSFNHCIDGLVLVDLTTLKPKKRARYIDAFTFKIPTPVEITASTETAESTETEAA
jgi:putative hemolysin